jgi:hypothetical protein
MKPSSEAGCAGNGWLAAERWAGAQIIDAKPPSFCPIVRKFLPVAQNKFFSRNKAKLPLRLAIDTCGDVPSDVPGETGDQFFAVAAS